MTLYIKIISEYCNYSYRIGLNTMTHTPSCITCCVSGLYCVVLKHTFQYAYFGTIACIVSIPKDAQFLSLGKIVKSDKIIVEKMMYLWDTNTIQYLVSLGAEINDDTDYSYIKVLKIYKRP